VRTSWSVRNTNLESIDQYTPRLHGIAYTVIATTSIQFKTAVTLCCYDFLTGLQHFKAYWLRDAPTGLTFNNCTF
jgi:hypothetical protein